MDPQTTTEKWGLRQPVLWLATTQPRVWVVFAGEGRPFFPGGAGVNTLQPGRNPSPCLASKMQPQAGEAHLFRSPTGCYANGGCVRRKKKQLGHQITVTRNAHFRRNKWEEPAKDGSQPQRLATRMRRVWHASLKNTQLCLFWAFLWLCFFLVPFFPLAKKKKRKPTPRFAFRRTSSSLAEPAVHLLLHLVQLAAPHIRRDRSDQQGMAYTWSLHDP